MTVYNYILAGIPLVGILGLVWALRFITLESRKRLHPGE
jgi:hypothetical protein